MQDKKDVRTAEVLDRDVRKYRKQLEIQTGQEGNAKAIKATKSSLALAEKRLKELTLSKLDSSNEETPTLPIYSDKLPVKSDSGMSVEDATKVVEEVYLRTLSRRPTAFELVTSQKAIAIAESPLNGVSDVLWALINSKEFILNH